MKQQTCINTCMIFVRLVILGLWAYFTWSSVEISINKYSTGKLIYLIFYCLLSILWIWSYIKCSWSDPGHLEDFYREKGVLENIKNGLIPRELASLPLCDRCGLPKPERCHHCRVCNKCVFRFDHHCPYIGNCVGLYNIKAFTLMTGYGGILMTIGCSLMCGNGYSDIGCIIGLVFGISLIIFPCNYIYGIFRNKTTNEELREMRGEVKQYSLTTEENLHEIYSSFFSAFIPTRSVVDGFHWNGIDISRINNDDLVNVQLQGSINVNEFQENANPQFHENVEPQFQDNVGQQFQDSVSIDIQSELNP